MRLIEIDQNNNANYQSFVRTEGSFVQDFQWGEFQKSLGKNIYRFALVEENTDSQILAVIQLIKMPAPGGFYLYAPYGPVLKDIGRLKFILEELHKKFSNAIFIRIEPRTTSAVLPASWPLPGLQKSKNLDPHKTLVLDLAKSTEQLLAEMHHKTRYNIKVAEKNTVQIKVMQYAENSEIFQPMLDTAKRAGIGSFAPKYYQQMLNFFGNQDQKQKSISTKLYTAWHQDDLLAANLMIYHGSTATYLFGGSSNIKRNMMAPYLLHWQAIKDAKHMGFAKYDFWGIEEDPNHAWAGISRFKFGFGGEIKEYFGTYDFVMNRTWYNVYKALRTLNLLRRKLIK